MIFPRIISALWRGQHIKNQVAAYVCVCVRSISQHHENYSQEIREKTFLSQVWQSRLCSCSEFEVFSETCMACYRISCEINVIRFLAIDQITGVLRLLLLCLLPSSRALNFLHFLFNCTHFVLSCSCGEISASSFSSAAWQRAVWKVDKTWKCSHYVFWECHSWA